MLRSLPTRLLPTHRRLRPAQCRSISASPKRCSDAVPLATPVEKIILDHIKAVGPMSYATYMQFCLAHPTEGYYMKSSNSIFGARGDFITSPDISQIFGEMIAIWLFSQWQAAGFPSNVRLVELGPGRGTLITDILRTITAFAGRIPENEKPALRIELVETSETLREIQRNKLGDASATVQWHQSIDHISPSPDSFTMLVAHEFFDALPIHVFRKSEEGWKELMVSSRLAGEGEDSEKQHPRLQHVLSPQKTAISTIFGNSSSRFQALPIGSDLEVSPTSFRLARKVGELLTKKNGASPGGCGLIIDYGNANAFGSSRRGFKDHEVVDIFHRPGECDLTANVDFAYLTESMQDLVPVHGPISQNQFLSMMGLMPRLEALLAASVGDKEKQKRILEGAQRIMNPTQMGSEYSVLGISTYDGTPYPFEVPDDNNQS